jgi:hypothetical protein
MGIYLSNKIFGISIYYFDYDDLCNILFEEKYSEIMSHEQMTKAYLFYNELHDKKNIFFKIYTECCSTLNKNNETFMMWYPITLDVFLEKFSL